MPEVRLSPSGPVLFGFGSGMQLRSSQNKCIGLDAETAQAAYRPLNVTPGNPLIVALANPKPDRRYGIQYRGPWSVIGEGTNLTGFELRISLDGAVTWLPAVTRWDHDLIFTTGAQTVVGALPMALGTNLGIVGTEPSIAASLWYAADSVDVVAPYPGGLDGNHYLELTELY